MVTDRTAVANRPDMTIYEKRTKRMIIVDLAASNTAKTEKNIVTKKEKYTATAADMKIQKQAKTVNVIPVVFSAMGVIT